MESLFNGLSGVSQEGARLALNGLWLGFLLTGLIWVVWRRVKITNPATGYIVWWSVLAMVITLPFLMNDFGYRNAVPEDNGRSLAASVTVCEPGPTVAQSRNDGKGSMQSASFSGKQSTHENTNPALLQELNPVEGGISAGQDPAHPEARRPLLSMLLRLSPVSFLGIWFFISAALSLRLFLAYRRIARIKRHSTPLDMSRLPRLSRLLKRVAAKRPVRVCLSSEIGFPVAAGLGDPVVLIPRRLAERLTACELEVVVLHELAHILRWDDWTKFGQKIIEALLFFNPAIHWIGRQLDLEREMACDDRVVAQIGRAGEYARCLTRVAQFTTVSDALLIPGVLTNRKQIFRRFDRLLNAKRDHGLGFSRLRFISVIVALIALLTVSVKVVPVIAVPGEAVTFDEFSETVKTYAAELLFDQDGGEPGNDPDPVSQKIGPEADEVGPIADAGDPLVTHDEAKDGQGSSVDETKAGHRVIDWDDELFSVPITGTIHRPGSGKGTFQVWINEDQTIRTAMQGKVKFTTDHRAVKSISRNGFLAVREKHGSTWRELDIERGEDGEPAYAYFVDGKRCVFDDEAGEWLGIVLRRMVPEIALVPAPEPEPTAVSVQVVPEVAAVSEPEPVQVVPKTVTVPDPAPIVEPVEILPEMAAISEPEPVAEPDDPPERRFRRPGLLGRIADWAGDLWDGDIKGTWISNDEDGESTICWSDGRNRLQVKTKGPLEFTEDDRAIKSVSEGGYFAVLEKRGSRQRELDVEPGSGGALNYAYYVNGDYQEFGDEAREWLGDILIDVIRKTGIGAQERVQRILRREGVDGVLAETALLESDYVARIYFGELLKAEQLDDDDYAKILGQVAQQIDSDYERAELLIALSDRVSENEALLGAYVDAVETIDSDYETRRVLSAVTMNNDTDEEIVISVLEIADSMESDYEKAELLISMAPNCRSYGRAQQAYVDAVIGLDSDYETRRVISALSAEYGLSRETITDLLAIARQMSSDYEKAEVLIELAGECESHPELQVPLIEAAASLSSDYETKRVLSSLRYDCEKNPEIGEAKLRTLEQISSDYEAAQILRELAGCAAKNRALSRAYLAAARRMNSAYEMKNSLTALINAGDPDRELILAILPVIAGMSSDYEKCEVLKKLAPSCRGDDDLEDAFLEVVDTIESEYEANELYAKLYRRTRRQPGDLD